MVGGCTIQLRSLLYNLIIESDYVIQSDNCVM